MKKLISILIIFLMLMTTAGCSCGMSCCGTKQNVPAAKGNIALAYDDESVKTVLAYFQANRGYVVDGTLLTEETDFAALGDTVKIAVVKDDATAEKLKAAGWIDTGCWTEGQKANNEKLFGYSVLEAPSSVTTDALMALTDWLGGNENSEAAELFKKFGN